MGGALCRALRTVVAHRPWRNGTDSRVIPSRLPTTGEPKGRFLEGGPRGVRHGCRFSSNPRLRRTGGSPMSSPCNRRVERRRSCPSRCLWGNGICPRSPYRRSCSHRATRSNSRRTRRPARRQEGEPVLGRLFSSSGPERTSLVDYSLFRRGGVRFECGIEVGHGPTIMRRSIEEMPS